MSILFYAPDSDQFPPVAPWTEDFLGEDGDPANPLYWEENIALGGTEEIQSNKLRLHLASQPEQPKVTAKFALPGDFSIEMDWALTVLGGTGYYCYLIANTPSTTFHLERNANPSVNLRRFIGASGVTAHGPGYGKFRLVRSGTTGTAYYDAGGGWTQLGSSGYIGPGNVSPLMAIAAVAGANVYLDIDYFKINSGTVIEA